MTIDCSRNNGFQVMASTQQLLQSFDALLQPEIAAQLGIAHSFVAIDHPA
jgi:hypothetical protein